MEVESKQHSCRQMEVNTRNGFIFESNKIQASIET